MKAIWKGALLALSDKTEIVESSYYFPPDSIKTEFLIESDSRSICPRKGQATYHHIVVDGQRLEDAAWVYRNPRPGYESIKGYVAFWRGVEVVSS